MFEGGSRTTMAGMAKFAVAQTLGPEVSIPSTRPETSELLGPAVQYRLWPRQTKRNQDAGLPSSPCWPSSRAMRLTTYSRADLEQFGDEGDAAQVGDVRRLRAAQRGPQ